MSKQNNADKQGSNRRDNLMRDLTGVDPISSSTSPSSAARAQPTQVFLSNERGQKTENASIKNDRDTPILSDLNISVVPIDAANESNENVSSAETISIGSDTSGLFDSSQFITDADTVLEDDNATDADTNTSLYQTCDNMTDSKTATINQQHSSSSEMDTLTADVSQPSPHIKIYDSIEEFEQNLPQTVVVLRNEAGSKVYLVGTAHFSRESQDDVSLVIRNVRPDVVMVELCTSRIHMISHDEKTLLEESKDMSFAKIQSITKTNGLVNGLFYILMLNMSAKLTRDLGMAPGGEFRRAVEEMKHLPNPVLHLGDRPINITLQRAFNGLSLWQTVKIAFKLIFSNKTITEEEVEQCKQKDLLEELLEQMTDEYPVFRDVLVNERDLYLCHSLSVAALPQINPFDGKSKPVTVVGVVGIGHTAGIMNHWGKVDESQLVDILTIPKASASNRVCKVTIKYGVLALIGYGIYRAVKPLI